MSHDLERRSSRLPVHTALKLPSSIPSASDTNILWSEDGTLFYLMKNVVMVMTPDTGINLRSITSTKTTIRKEDIPVIGWYRTILDVVDRETSFNWNLRCTDPESRSLGSFDLSVLAIALSPTDMLSGASCVLATLTTNMDLCLWYAPKNCISGPWTKVYDVTPFLIDYYDAEGLENVAATKNSQITCITWTRMGYFGISPSLELDTSLLICGTRAGSIVLLRYTESTDIEHVLTVPVSHTWIKRICYSSWVTTSSRSCETTIAFATSEGAIGLAKIIQRLITTETTSSFAFYCRVEAIADEAPSLIYPPDLGNVTALQWLELVGRSRILVHGKPGVLYLWSDASKSGWSGYHQMTVHTLHPITGVNYLGMHDVLVVAFLDGSLSVIANVSTEPSLASATPDHFITSQSLSRAIGSVVKRAEDDEVRGTATRNGGFTFYVDQGLAVWIHERVYLSDFSFTGNSKHNSLFMVAQLWDESGEEVAIHEFTTAIGENTEISPLNGLRSSFFHLGSLEKITKLHDRIHNILEKLVVDDSASIILDSWIRDQTPEMRRGFRSSLRRHLYGWNSIRSLRSRLTFADFAWKLCDNDKMRNDYGLAAQNLLNTISHRNLRTIIRHLIAIVSVMTVQDIPFILRIVLQSSLPGCPGDITVDAQTLSKSLQAVFPDLLSIEGGLTESCPACGGRISLNDITSGVCPNGHVWARCSVTTFILTSTDLRTCIGCTRKAFLPASTLGSPEQLPVVVRGWVVQELLHAVHRCLFCGNGFAAVL